MRIKVTMHEAKTNLSWLVVQAEAGEGVIITRAGKPVARLVPARAIREPGSARGAIWIAPDFDAPLPEQVLAGFEGESEDASSCGNS
ncbi:MAG TPA: type II toxin-antitoxin system prevent-host-death family antitoxin [Thermomicrobiaceae bacterium]|nr:type II toxin-antitoxin system prevent-host-death family antitoxin [Thermomicrobiaceae bacterium]